MTKYNTATPYIASFVILKKNGKIAFVLRTHTGWMDGYYGLPSGKVEKGEAFTTAAIREAKEEVGATIQKEDLRYVLTMRRKHNGPGDATEWVDVLFEVTKWEGEPYNAEPHKHGELVWLDPKNLPENMVPPIRFALEEISKGRQYTEYGWED